MWLLCSGCGRVQSEGTGDKEPGERAGGQEECSGHLQTEHIGGVCVCVCVCVRWCVVHVCVCVCGDGMFTVCGVFQETVMLFSAAGVTHTHTHTHTHSCHGFWGVSRDSPNHT